MQNVSFNCTDHQKNSNFTNTRWRTAAILRTVKSPYLCSRLWWNLMWWRILALYSGKIIKISNFWKFNMAAAAIWKIRKIAISLQRFDWFLQSLLHWCKMGLLTARPLKKFEFHKSKMADGRHFKNCYIILSQQPFYWFLLNLARWCMLVPRAWRKFQIFNFRQSYTADRRYLANRKTV